MDQCQGGKSSAVQKEVCGTERCSPGDDKGKFLKFCNCFAANYGRFWHTTNSGLILEFQIATLTLGSSTRMMTSVSMTRSSPSRTARAGAKGWMTAGSGHG